MGFVALISIGFTLSTDWNNRYNCCNSNDNYNIPSNSGEIVVKY
jgi:hypothetical protein